MQFPKAINVEHDDRVVITPAGSIEEVSLNIHEDDGAFINLWLKPKQARALARALKHAANVAEGKPAKAPKGPRGVLMDRDGDTWHRNPNGFYSLFRPDEDADNSLSWVRENYGPLRDVAEGNA